MNSRRAQTNSEAIGPNKKTLRSKIHKVLWFVFIALTFASSTGLSMLFLETTPAKLASHLQFLNWEKKEGKETIALMFTGDIMLGRYIATLREKNGGDFPFTYMPDILTSMSAELGVDELDLVAGNLEGPITDSSYINPGTSLIFNFKPELADLLAKVGFTTLDMANNHVFNQGVQGLDKTYNYLQAAGIRGFGHPDTPLGDYSFTSYEFQNTTVGFLGLNDTDFKLDEAETLARIRELDTQVDFLIVAIHWGIEYETTARGWMEELAHKFVNSGADMVWGTHPHVIQNRELYSGAPIYYSLGNFVFDQYFSSLTKEGLIVGLRLDNTDGEIKVTTAEMYVDLVNQGEPKPRN